MSLKGTENNTNMAQAMAAAREQQAPVGQQSGFASPAQQQTQGRGFHWRAMGAMMSTPMGRNPQSEILTRLQKALEECYKNANSTAYELGVVPVDFSQDPDLAMSVLLVTARSQQARDLGIAYHVLLLEGSSEPLPSQFENIMGENVEIPRMASDASNARTAGAVIKALNRLYPNARFVNADACVVPRDFNMEDPQRVFQLAANAAFAVTHELEQRTTGFVDVNLAEASRDDTLQSRVEFPKTQLVNVVGQPVRADFSVNMTAVPANQSRAQAAVDRAVVLARATGYVDLVWAPSQVQQQPQYYGQPINQQPNYLYTPRLVLTSMEAVAASTLPAQLFALVNAMSIRENSVWTQSFRPQPFQDAGTQKMDMHDICAIGLETPGSVDPATGMQVRFNVGAEGLKTDTLNKLLGMAVRPTMALSLDIEESGPSTWYNGAFAVAGGAGDPATVAAANEYIIRAANYLTNGAFGKHFQQNGRICFDEGNRIQLGYYTDASGQKCDIRDLDYLGVLNCTGHTDPMIIRRWSETFNNANINLFKRLQERRKLIQAILPNVVFTGYARRVTFDAGFLNALAQACLECGLDVKSITPYVDQGGQERTGAEFLQSSLLTPANTGLFNRSFGNYQGNNQGMQFAQQNGFTGGRF